MKHLVVVTGDKGGVGKTFTARTLADYLMSGNHSFRAFDTDRTNATFCRFYPTLVECIDVENPQDLDQLLTELSEKDSTFLMDCAARTMDSLLKWIHEIDLLNLKQELGITLTLVFVLGPEKDCVQILTDVVGEFGAQANYLIVKNRSRGRNFEIYETSALRQKLLTQLNAQEMDLPALLEKTTLQMDRGNLSWNEALTHPSLQIADRQRVKLYRNQMSELLKQRLCL